MVPYKLWAVAGLVATKQISVTRMGNAKIDSKAWTPLEHRCARRRQPLKALIGYPH